LCGGGLLSQHLLLSSLLLLLLLRINLVMDGLKSVRLGRIIPLDLIGAGHSLFLREVGRLLPLFRCVLARRQKLLALGQFLLLALLLFLDLSLFEEVSRILLGLFVEILELKLFVAVFVFVHPRMLNGFHLCALLHTRGT
jgi:hypothetical protein